ncbi:MAG: CHAT domain-containing protein [Cyanobacteria bacterium P01_A01_bin.17]
MKRYARSVGLCLGLMLLPAAAQAQRIPPATGQQIRDLISQNERTFPDGQNDRPRRGGSGIGLPDLFQIFRNRPTAPRPQSPRGILEDQLKDVRPAEAVQLFEAWQAQKFSQYLEMPAPGTPVDAAQISQRLGQLSRLTGQRSGLLYVVALEDELQLLFIPPSDSPVAQQPFQIASSRPGQLAQASPTVVREVLGKVDRSDVLKEAKKFRREVSDPSKVNTASYLKSSQKLYQWIVQPLVPQLQAHGIETLLFSMDDKLRSLPIAALHDGQQFLIEKHQVALIPSFQLTESSYGDLRKQTVLAMGVSESTQGLSPLPAVPVELAALANHFWQGQSHATLNQDSTLSNLQTFHQQNRYGIIHLATHAQFKSGAPQNSFIQFWNGKLNLNQLRGLSQSLRWQSNPSVDLLVLSACQTAVGSEEAELGFAGSALNAGVNSTVASLWMISDEGTLGVMSKFYEHLRSAPTRTEAMRQAQLAMLQGKVQITNEMLQLSDQVQMALPPALAQRGDRNFTHPYFWSGYTVIGNWN